jgi:biopolymer transport protein ExbD
VNFKRQSREQVEVNLTPLIDIVFLLLIFFMVSTTFTKEQHLNIDLPEASAEAAEQPPESLDILITATGEYSVNGQGLVNNQLDTLKRALTTSLNGRETAPVVLTADAKTPHEAVVRAMDAAGQLGLVNLSITTRQPVKSE